MKCYSLLFFVIILFSCNKNSDVTPAADSAQSTLSAKDGSGSGGNNNNTGFIQSVSSGSASRLISTHSDSIWVTFTQPAPAGGWTLQLTSSDPSAAQVPATYPVPEGASVVHPPVIAGNIANAKNVTISVKLFSQVKTTVLKVFPLTATFPAPQLQSPSDGAGIGFRIQVKFTWNDNFNAYYSHFQISTDKAFTDLVTDLLLDQPIWGQSYFNGTGTRYWRVSYVDASGNQGPWSQVRSFVEKAQ